jgi:predicted glycoside hydrolase/deacetylase ChbG (UPF0249 family)
MLIITADDWGLKQSVTDAIFACFQESRITTASAMVYMEDSERAATLARVHHLPIGLHLNFSEPYTGAVVSGDVRERQAKLVSYFASNRWMKAVFNPFLVSDVEACIREQLDAFALLYGSIPPHIDSHHHMHVSPNVLLSRALPRSIPLRRTYTYSPSERSRVNRAWRFMWNKFMSRRFPGTQVFLDVRSLDCDAGQRAKLEKLTEAHRVSVEVMTHPGSPKEFDLLMSDRWAEITASYVLGAHSDINIHLKE